MAHSGKILLVGFEPFGGEAINPSAEAARRLAGRRIADYEVMALILPVSFTAAPALLRTALAEHRPRVALAVGQAGGRSRLSLERVALNLIDARIPDSDGDQPVDVSVIGGAPPAYFSNLPLKAALTSLTARGIPCELSLSAGTYVCNAVFFTLMHTLATNYPQARGGFLHVPYLPEQAARHPGAPSMGLQDVLDGITLVLELGINVAHDLSIPAGMLH